MGIFPAYTSEGPLGRKTVLDPLELDLQGDAMWVLRVDSRPSERAASAPNSSPSPYLLRQGLASNLKFTISARLPCQRDPGIYCLYCKCQCWCHSCGLPHPVFTRVFVT